MDEEQNAKLNSTEQFATVLVDYKEIRLFRVKRLDAPQTMIVQVMRNATSYLGLALEKNVSHYVGKIHVHLVLLVLQIITEKYVLATTLFKETDMFLVLNVSRF